MNHPYMIQNKLSSLEKDVSCHSRSKTMFRTGSQNDCKMIPAGSGFESPDLSPKIKAAKFRLSLDLEAHVNRMHTNSKKTMRQHCWDEASLFKKRIRMMNM